MTLLPFGAQPLQLQRRALFDASLEKPVAGELAREALDRADGDAQPFVAQKARDLGERFASVEAAHDANLAGAEPIVLLRGKILDDEARRAAIRLLDDREISAQAGRRRAHRLARGSSKTFTGRETAEHLDAAASHVPTNGHRTHRASSAIHDDDVTVGRDGVTIDDN